ncbi:unnamed protein product [Musa acuminata var. zebrina]
MADPSPSPPHLSSAPAFALTYRSLHTSSLSSPLAVRSTQRARPLRPLPPPPRTGQARPPLSSLTRRTRAVTSMRTSESRSTPPAPLATPTTPSASSDAERPISTPMVPPPLYPASDPL